MSAIARRTSPGIPRRCSAPAEQTPLTPTPLPREAFALEPGLRYFNHAAVGVLPVRTRDAVLEAVRHHAAGGVLGMIPLEQGVAAARAVVARFIGGRATEIAFLRNTTDGANVIARGLAWKPGDEIILSDNEFGANALPWLALKEYGVVVRFIQTKRERMTADVLARMMTPKTKLVTVSWVSFDDGYRHDLAALCDIAHAGGALFCVDAIQGLGVFPVDVGRIGIDAFYAGGAKWLMSLVGVSFLYVNESLQERLSVRWPGWRALENIWNFLDYDQPLAQSAARYEGGSQNFLGVLSLRHSIDVLAEAGAVRIGEHVLALTDRLVAGLHAVGAQVDSPRGPGISSGIVTFSLPGQDSIELGRRLQNDEKIVTTFRSSGVRVSPHGYNTLEEIDALVEALHGRVRAR